MLSRNFAEDFIVGENNDIIENEIVTFLNEIVITKKLEISKQNFSQYLSSLPNKALLAD